MDSEQFSVEVLKTYYSPFSSQEKKLQAQEIIQNFLEVSYDKWYDIMSLINGINDSSLINEDSNLVQIQLYWPLQTLRHIIETKFSQISDPTSFYTELFSIYMSKLPLIISDHFLFTKFLQLFTSLAVHDENTDNFSHIVAQFCVLLTTSDAQVHHLSFFSKYLYYLYEDVYETKSNFTISVHHEEVLKSELEELIKAINGVSNREESFDDAYLATACLLVLTHSSPEIMKAVDINSFSWISNYFLPTMILLKCDWVDSWFLDWTLGWLEVIWKGGHSDGEFWQLWWTLLLVAKRRDGFGLDKKVDKKIIILILQILYETDGNYRAVWYLFDALMLVISGRDWDNEGLLELSKEMIRHCIKKSK
jgi:hypothetical protein